MSSLTVLAGSSLKSSSGEPLSQPLVAASDPGHPWLVVAAPQTLLCAPAVLCLCVSFPSSYTVPVTGLEAIHRYQWGFPGDSNGKEFSCSAGDPGSVPEGGRSLAGGHGNPLQYPFLENAMDRGAWPATVHGAARSWT